MSDPKTEIHDVDPAEWRSNLEYKLKHELFNCSMSDRITFIKKMTNRLKLTLDDIRGVNKSDKYSALNSIPPDVLPIKIQLVNGEAIVLLEVNPVVTCYEDLLTNVRGDIVHLYVRRKGEELPEDFLPPRKMLTIRPPPPGFVRSPLLKLFSVQTTNENYVPQSRPSTSKELETLLDEKCEDEVTLGVNEDVDKSDKKIQEEPTFKIIKEDETLTEEKPHEESLFCNIKEEDPSLPDKHKKELIPDTSTEEHTKTDKILQEEATLNVSIDKYTPIEEKYQEVSMPDTSMVQNSPIDEKNRLSLTAGQGYPQIDKMNPDESVSDMNYDEDTSNNEKNLNDANDLSDAKIQFIDIDSSSYSSTDNSDRFQVLGLIELDSLNGTEEPEVELEK